MFHVRNMVCAHTMALSNKHAVFDNFSAALVMRLYFFMLLYVSFVCVYVLCFDAALVV